MKYESEDQEGGSGIGRSCTQSEIIVAAWRQYLASPEENQEPLLRALDRLIITAVGWANRGRLDHALCEDVVQEVRLQLVPDRFLLSSAPLLALSAEAERNAWTDEDSALVAQTIANLVHMVARWEVSSFVRSESRLQARQHAWLASQNHEPKIVPETESEQRAEQRFRETILREALRHHGYTEQDGRLIESYFAGHLTQTALGEALGIQQAAISKRLAILRQWMARACRREDGPSPG